MKVPTAELGVQLTSFYRVFAFRTQLASLSKFLPILVTNTRFRFHQKQLI